MYSNVSFPNVILSCIPSELRTLGQRPVLHPLVHLVLYNPYFPAVDLKVPTRADTRGRCRAVRRPFVRYGLPSGRLAHCEQSYDPDRSRTSKQRRVLFARHSAHTLMARAETSL
jgi:hypothetical protein